MNVDVFDKILSYSQSKMKRNIACIQEIQIGLPGESL